ncbi:NAD(P)H-dependent FMN reductase [Thermomonospora echinospora]|uniref:NAD(P)H-dependent FMN reductase n=1 Tax=Thermomonospora echinospora TaxID=1992 RepID=A0A1H6DYM3_9ACTN|nr:NAD(P)H-dependent oxidoreductase [Thermomonospora echinospora]SEG90428.1 NAD(P)H-dependent FMN reductase [Thermomonospora echinospora]
MTFTTPHTAPLRTVMIISSTRKGRFGSTVARWFAEQAGQRTDMTLDVIDLSTAGLPDTLVDDDDDVPEPVRALTPRLAAADAFVIVTPEYNHSFPAPLKTAIDWFVDEWRAKPVGLVSYGGRAGGLRAVEQLRLVFAALHATTVRETVSFHNCRDKFDDAGRPIDAAGCDAAAKSLLDQLAWWAHALRDARATRPYGL